MDNHHHHRRNDYSYDYDQAHYPNMEELQAKESSSSSSELHFAWKILDFLTGPAGAVFVALLAVGFHYYQNAIRNVGIVSWIRREVVGLIRNGFDGIASFFYEWSS